MPAYAAGSVAAIYPGDSVLLLDTERPLSGTYSRQVALGIGETGETAPSVSLELQWPTDPGAFDFELQDADTDDVDAYLTVATIGTLTTATIGPSGKYFARAEFVPLKGRFARIYIKTQTANAVKGSAKISR